MNMRNKRYEINTLIRKYESMPDTEENRIIVTSLKVLLIILDMEKELNRNGNRI